MFFTRNTTTPSVSRKRHVDPLSVSVHEQGLLDIPGSDVTSTVWEFKITSALSLNATVKSGSLESAAQVSNR